MSKPSDVHSFIPILDWIRSYTTDHFKGDLNAGLTVAIMLIPQGMAYAVLAGMPPVYGLYASIVPLIIYAGLGTSRQLAVGPVAMVALLVVAGIGEFAEVGSDRFIRLAILTALGVGLVQFLMGVLRMGFLVNFLSHPVLSGFTSAAALIIAASQVRNLLGIDLPQTNYIHEVVTGAFRNIDEINPYTSLIGLGSIGTILWIRKWKRTFPSALIVVAAGTLITAFFQLNSAGVSIIGEIPRGLPAPEWQDFTWADLRQILPTVLIISLVSYMESYAVAKVIANKHGYPVNANQELVALGAANIGGFLFQSFPVTGGFSRSAVNDQAGARTGMASIITAGMIALTVLFLTPLFYYLPGAVLAAIIMIAVAGLFDVKTMIRLWKTDRKDLAMLSVTFIATLTLGIEEGIAIGVILSLVIVIYGSTRPHSTVLGQLGDTDNFRNIGRYPKAEVTEEVLIFRFDAPLYFANTEHFLNRINKLAGKKGEKLEVVILDASAINSIDSTGIHTVENLIQDLQVRRIGFYIAGAIGPVRDKLKTSGITTLVGEEHFFFDVSDAVTYHKTKSGNRNLSDTSRFSPIQSNT
ncbi:MAG: solute carrier family 26 protein [Balneolaceae bacterium]